MTQWRCGWGCVEGLLEEFPNQIAASATRVQHVHVLKVTMFLYKFHVHRTMFTSAERGVPAQCRCWREQKKARLSDGRFQSAYLSWSFDHLWGWNHDLTVRTGDKISSVSDLLVCSHDYFNCIFSIASLQESTLDTRTSTAVESLLSLRSSIEEWSPPSPASSTTSESLLSPPRVVREEVISSLAAGEGSAGEAPVSSSGLMNVVSADLLFLCLRTTCSWPFAMRPTVLTFRARRQTHLLVVSIYSDSFFHSTANYSQ